MMDLTAGIFLVTSDPSKPRLIINLGQTNNNNNENQVTIEINSNIGDKVLFKFVEALNSAIYFIKYHWEVCSLTGEVLGDNFSEITKKLTSSLLNDILNRVSASQDEIKLNYNFLIRKDQIEKEIATFISLDEENIITIIKSRATKSIQSGMLKKYSKFENFKKNEILSILRGMVEKKILIQSGSWFMLKKR